MSTHVFIGVSTQHVATAQALITTLQARYGDRLTLPQHPLLANGLNVFEVKIFHEGECVRDVPLVNYGDIPADNEEKVNKIFAAIDAKLG